MHLIWELVTFRNKTNFQTAIPVNVESQSGFKVTKNDAIGNRTKYINIFYRIVLCMVEDKTINISYYPTNIVATDIYVMHLSKFRSKVSGIYWNLED